MKRLILFLITAVLIVATIGITSAEEKFVFPDTDDPQDCSITQYESNTGLEIYTSPSYSAERIYAVQKLSPYVAARDLRGEWLYIFFFDEEDLRGGWVPLAQVAVPIEDYNELCVGSGGVVPDKPNLGYDDSAAVKVDQIIVTNTPTSTHVPTSRPPTSIPPSATPVPPTSTNTPIPPSATTVPTATNTPIPPPTNTSVPPPPTDTPVPPPITITPTEPGGGVTFTVTPTEPGGGVEFTATPTSFAPLE